MWRRIHWHHTAWVKKIECKWEVVYVNASLYYKQDSCLVNGDAHSTYERGWAEAWFFRRMGSRHTSITEYGKGMFAEAGVEQCTMRSQCEVAHLLASLPKLLKLKQGTQQPTWSATCLEQWFPFLTHTQKCFLPRWADHHQPFLACLASSSWSSSSSNSFLSLCQAWK